MDDNLKYTWYADIINIAVTVEGKSGLLTLLLFNRHGKVLEGFELIGKTVVRGGYKSCLYPPRQRRIQINVNIKSLTFRDKCVIL